MWILFESFLVEWGVFIEWGQYWLCLIYSGMADDGWGYDNNKMGKCFCKMYLREKQHNILG